MVYGWESGTLNQIYKSHHPPPSKCRVDYRPRASNAPLTLLDLSSAFVLWGVGLSLSIIVFAVERVMSAKKRQMAIIQSKP